MSEAREQQEIEGGIRVANEVIASIAAMAPRGVAGVPGME